MKKTFTVCLLALLATCNKSWAQQDEYFSIHPIYYTIFDRDSLVGFDEPAARAAAISEQFYGSEFRIKMYRLKREYINNKYNLVKAVPNTQSLANTGFRPAAPVLPGCVNEDFEASTATAVITVSTQIAGWTVTGGYNGYVGAGSPATLQAYYPNGQSNPTLCGPINTPLPPSHSALVDCTGGLIDPQIGNQYPIYSVFGSGVPNAAAAAANPQYNGSMFGTKVFRLNDGVTGDYSIEKLSKTFSVTANNALFQFAFINVFNPGHACCDAGVFAISLTNATANTLIPCPNFSVSAPSSQCTATVPFTYYVGSPGSGTNTPGTVYDPNTYVSVIYNRWQVSSMDLSAYIGQNITIDITVGDCNAGGHMGKVYFDAQCGPMVVIGNGISFPAGNNNVIVPTCGATGATICAPAGLGPYSWAGPNLSANASVPSLTNQCITSTISATYTLYMQPPGACVPITRVVQSTVTPAPLLNISVAQAVCGSTQAIVSATPAGSAANPPFINWSPTPLSQTSNSAQATYTIPASPTATNLIMATASDNLGCLVSATAAINPAPPVPSFTLNNLTGTYSITCNHPTIGLDVLTSYNYNGGYLKYFWASSSSTFVTNSIANSSVGIVNPGTYTVFGSDTITQCGVTRTVAIGINTVQPVFVAITPTLQNITCSVGASAVSATATPTVNISQNIMSPNGTPFSVASPTASYLPGPLGTYTWCLKDDNNGCTTCRTFSIVSNDGFPTYSVVSPSNFTLGCTTKATATINIVGAQTTPTPGGPISYTLLGPPTSSVAQAGILSSQSVYTINVPGTWTVITRDNTSFCETKTSISILSNTFAPAVSAFIPRDILDCNVPKETLKGLSTTPNVEYIWTFPGTPNTQLGDTLSIKINSTSVTQTLVANYSLTVRDKNSTCTSTSIIPIYQNLFPPNPIISNGGTSALSCRVPSVTLTNLSNGTIPSGTGFPNNLPVVATRWDGPTPQEPLLDATVYEGRVAGVYTLTAKDLNNGCTKTGTILIGDNRDYPVLNIPPVPVKLPCGAQSIKLAPNIVFAPNAVPMYTWTTIVPFKGTNTLSTFEPTQPGGIALQVLDNFNGCMSFGSYEIVNGSLTANFSAPDTTGFAPLTLNLANTSRYQLSDSTFATDGITSLWNFGNGTTYSATSTSSMIPSPAVTFSQAGTYTVTLYSQKGACLNITQKIIHVELPSELTIPNVFTPNGDGINDVFFVKIKSMSEINVLIVDRWGHKVYELANSDNGNVLWDGKNQAGKEVPEGTYFYVIKASGKDGQTFNKNGTINLFR